MAFVGPLVSDSSTSAIASSWSAILASMTSSFLSRPCLWNASAEPTRSQMPFASSSCCSTLTNWYFKEDDPALMTSTFNDLPPSVFLKRLF